MTKWRVTCPDCSTFKDFATEDAADVWAEDHEAKRHPDGTEDGITIEEV